MARPIVRAGAARRTSGAISPFASAKRGAIRRANRSGGSRGRCRIRASDPGIARTSCRKGEHGHAGRIQRRGLEADDGVRRRDFINIAAVSFAGVGAVAVVLPLVNQMNPSADVLALASTEVDISKIAPGQAIKTSWRKQPVFVRNLTPQEIAGRQCGPTSASCAIRRRSPSGPSRASRTG